MNRPKPKSIALFLCVIAAIGVAYASDLAYTTLVPQTNDDPLIASHRATVAAAPRLNQLITASGTNTLTSVAMLDRVIISKAGSSDSQVVLTDGTNALCTISTAAQNSLAYYTVITSGTLKAVTTGTTAPNLTLTYR